MAPASAALRTRCRDPKCRGALPAPTGDLRRTFCCRGCYERFHRTRCRVCAEPSPNGRLHVRKCSYAHKQNPDLYAYKKLLNSSNGGLSPKRPRDERNPIKTGIKTRTRSWGPTLTDDQFWLATLPNHDAPRVARINRGYWEAAEQAKIKANGNFAEPEWREAISSDGVRCFAAGQADAAA
jgi:hypothetical protein